MDSPLTLYSDEQHPVSNSHTSYAIYKVHLQPIATNSTMLASVTRPMRYISPLTSYSDDSTLSATVTRPMRYISPLTAYSDEQHLVSDSHTSYAIYRSTYSLQRRIAPR